MVKKQWQVGQVITESGGKVAGFIWAHDERPMDRKFQIQQGHNVQVRNWARQHKTEVLAQKYRDGAIDEGRAPVKFAEQPCVRLWLPSWQSMGIYGLAMWQQCSQRVQRTLQLVTTGSSMPPADFSSKAQSRNSSGQGEFFVQRQSLPHRAVRV